MLEEEKLAIADARRTSAKATGVAPLSFGLNSHLVHFPFFPIGWIGEQIIEVLVGVLVL